MHPVATAPAQPPSLTHPTAGLSWRRLIEKVGVGLAILDLDGRFQEANAGICELSGYQRDELLGPGFEVQRLCLPEDLAGFGRGLAALQAGDEDTYRKPWQLLRKDGLAVWVDLVVNLLRDSGGAPHALVLTAVDITEQRRAEDAFRSMSYHDPLTKLPNRRLLHDRLHHAVAQAQREQRSLALLFIDLDEFKPINDRLGHEAGDWLLKAVARRLLDCIRAYDTAARFGGDEFVVLIPDVVQADDVMRVAERILTALAEPFITDEGQRLDISCSIGMALYPEDAATDRELLRAGDEAMYLAKKAGRNRIVRSERSAVPMPLGASEEEVSTRLIHLRWEAHFASGNAFIDAEHRELFRQSNQLLDLIIGVRPAPADVRSALERLMQLVSSHFKHEERLLEKWSFPGLADHAYQHRRLLEHAEQIARLIGDQSIPTAELLGFLIDEMIRGHMLNEDRGYFHVAKAATDT